MTRRRDDKEGQERGTIRKAERRVENEGWE